MKRTNHQVVTKETTTKVEPKSIIVSTQNHGVGRSSLTISQDHVITSGSLTIGLEELKHYIRQYEDLE